MRKFCYSIASINTFSFSRAKAIDEGLEIDCINFYSLKMTRLIRKYRDNRINGTNFKPMRVLNKTHTKPRTKNNGRQIHFKNLNRCCNSGKQ